MPQAKIRSFMYQVVFRIQWDSSLYIYGTWLLILLILIFCLVFSNSSLEIIHWQMIWYTVFNQIHIVFVSSITCHSLNIIWLLFLFFFFLAPVHLSLCVFPLNVIHSNGPIHLLFHALYVAPYYANQIPICGLFFIVLMTLKCIGK